MRPQDELRYERLVNLVFERGEHFRKDHGEWIRLRISDELAFVMDSWNRAIALVAGSAEYDNRHSGFRGNAIERVGINFGRFVLYVTPGRLEALIRVAEQCSSIAHATD